MSLEKQIESAFEKTFSNCSVKAVKKGNEYYITLNTNHVLTNQDGIKLNKELEKIIGNTFILNEIEGEKVNDQEYKSLWRFQNIANGGVVLAYIDFKEYKKLHPKTKKKATDPIFKKPKAAPSKKKPVAKKPAKKVANKPTKKVAPKKAVTKKPVAPAKPKKITQKQIIKKHDNDIKKAHDSTFGDNKVVYQDKVKKAKPVKYKSFEDKLDALSKKFRVQSDLSNVGEMEVGASFVVLASKLDYKEISKGYTVFYYNKKEGHIGFINNQNDLDREMSKGSEICRTTKRLSLTDLAVCDRYEVVSSSTQKLNGKNFGLFGKGPKLVKFDPGGWVLIAVRDSKEEIEKVLEKYKKENSHYTKYEISQKDIRD